MAHVAPLTTQRECSVCFESKPATNIYIAPCEHAYCHDCVLKLFNDSLKDNSIFPPRCCRRELTIASLSHILGEDLAWRAELKVIENNMIDKTYCAAPRCSAFIPPYMIGGTRATCSTCEADTCTVCKAAYHRGGCGPSADSDEQAIEFAQAQGWRRCYACHAFVELTVGCNHMRCRCRAESCYTCGARWKTCACAQWNEARLLARPVAAMAALAAAVRPLRPAQPVVQAPHAAVGQQPQVVNVVRRAAAATALTAQNLARMQQELAAQTTAQIERARQQAVRRAQQMEYVRQQVERLRQQVIRRTAALPRQGSVMTHTAQQTSTTPQTSGHGRRVQRRDQQVEAAMQRLARGRRALSNARNSTQSRAVVDLTL